MYLIAPVMAGCGLHVGACVLAFTAADLDGLLVERLGHKVHLGDKRGMAAFRSISIFTKLFDRSSATPQLAVGQFPKEHSYLQD